MLELFQQHLPTLCVQSILAAISPLTLEKSCRSSRSSHEVTPIAVAEAVAIENITAETVSRAIFDTWISRFGCPVYLTTDQGRQFEAALFQRINEIPGHKPHQDHIIPPTSKRFSGTFT
ncbi:hypothetical protein TNCV_2801841 [Trichonephila clavipes]|nr:hypothetical protein TNCV_2801841 [Trichonephila clavipes]